MSPAPVVYFDSNKGGSDLGQTCYYGPKSDKLVTVFEEMNISKLFNSFSDLIIGLKVFLF